MPTDAEAIEYLNRRTMPSDNDAISFLDAKKANERPDDFSFRNMVSNIPSSAVQLGSDMAQPFLHPVDTAQGLGNLALGAYQKFTPGIQPEEANIDALGDMISDRYGSVDNTLNTLEDDPLGMLSDFSGLLMGGGTLAARLPGQLGKIGKAAATVGRAVDPLNVAVNSANALRKAVTSPGKPAKLMESAAKFSTTIPPQERAVMMQTMLNEGIVPLPKGVSKMYSSLDAFDGKINELVKTATEEGKLIKKSRVLRHVQKLKNSMTDPSNLDPVGNLNKIDSTVKKWAEPLESVDYLTPEQVQNFKVKAYKEIKFAKDQHQAKLAVNEARATMARGAKDSMTDVIPELGDINKRYGRLREIEKPLIRASGRNSNRDIMGIGTPIKAAAGGALGGGTGAFIGGLYGLLDNPYLKSKNAISLHNLLNTGYSDIFTKNRAAPALIRQGLTQTGRASSQPFLDR